MYDPVEMRKKYMELERGKPRMAGIRSAIAEADKHKDVPYQIYFRSQFCEESCFYGDGLDMVVMFPELLALVDKNPSAPTTRHNRNFKNSLDNVLWVYKWVLGHCESFYQVSIEDWLAFLEDFKKRSLAFGYNLRPYYEYLYELYNAMDDPRSEEAFAQFEKLPHDGNCNCRACERNTEINYYLEHDNLDMAVRLSREIENFSLICGASEKNRAWLRLKKNYLWYYLRHRDKEKIAEHCRLLERNMNGEAEFDCWSELLEGYAWVDLGKALKIYKEHWKEWLEERCPVSVYGQNKQACIFFRELGKARKGEYVKLPLDTAFSGYREDGKYRIRDMYQFHYGRAWDMAEKFDARNGTDAYCKTLEEALADTIPAEKAEEA